jgi:ammonium transporter, Amt family
MGRRRLMGDDDGVSCTDLANDANAFWLMFGAILVFFMQTGFTMLEVGSVQHKNSKNILIKNIFDAAIGSLIWWLIGYGIAFGSDEGRFVGTTHVSQSNHIFFIVTTKAPNKSLGS